MNYYQTQVKKIAVVNRYYRITHFYSFMRELLIKGSLMIVLFLIAVFIVDYIFDIHQLLQLAVNQFETYKVHLLLYVSETLLGLLPPEVFIAWAGKSSHPILNLFILSSMSYLGGISSYFIGRKLYLIPKIKSFVESKIQKHVDNLLRWGGLFVFIGAMLPLPHSMVSMACGLIKYDFKSYLLWALFRFLRFAIYGYAIFIML